MKKLVFGLIATVVFAFNGNAQKVGESRDGKFVITEDLSFLKEKWDDLLKDNKIDGEIDRFEITAETYKDDKTNEDVTYYQITGYTKDNFGKVASVLSFDKIAFSLEASSSSCTCSGCTYGCHPRLLKGVAWCCIDGCNECTKTETAGRKL